MLVFQVGIVLQSCSVLPLEIAVILLRRCLLIKKKIIVGCGRRTTTHFEQQSKCVVTHQLAGALRQTLTNSNPQILT